MTESILEDKPWQMTLTSQTARLFLWNIRNLQSKAWNKRNPNWILIRDVFGKGSNTAHKMCKDLKLDPDTHHIEIYQP